MCVVFALRRKRNKADFAATSPKAFIAVQLVKDKSPVADMSIDVTDKNGNFSEGKTDKAGQLTVPGTSGLTNDDGKVTVGWEDADRDRWTLTVKVEDFETKRPIAGAGVAIGRTGHPR